MISMMSEVDDDPYSRRKERMGMDIFGDDLDLLMDEKEKPLTA